VDFCDLEEHFEAWNLLTDTRVRVLWRVAVMPSGHVARAWRSQSQVGRDKFRMAHVTLKAVI
jgi:hypothetical protein